MPRVVAYTQPFVYGGDCTAGLTDQTDPSAVGDGAPAMEVPLCPAVTAPKDDMLPGVCKLLIKDGVTKLGASLLLSMHEECVSTW